MNKQVFSENVVIITGASYGIGECLAHGLARQGAWLALAARSLERLEAVSNQCRELGGRAVAIPTDVAEQPQCQALVERTVAEYGRVDTLINNAGIGSTYKFDGAHDLDLFEKVMQVNFFGSVYCTHYALPYIKESRGRLVGIASLRGKFPSGFADGYGPAKHAMAGFFGSLRNELIGSGVSVTMIYPNWVRTGITTRALGTDGKPTGETSSHEIGAMPVETCTRIILKAIAKRKREVVMTAMGKLGLWMMLIAPGIVDIVVRKELE